MGLKGYLNEITAAPTEEEIAKQREEWYAKHGVSGVDAESVKTKSPYATSSNAQPNAPQITVGKIAFGVFLGELMMGMVCAIIYVLLQILH